MSKDRDRGERGRSPEERTAAMFSLNYGALATELKKREIALPGGRKRIRIQATLGYSRNDNSTRQYAQMQEMEPGTVWFFPLRLRRTCLALVVAKDRGETGACVRIVRASQFDSQKGDFVPFKREGDIARYLGFGEGEMGRLSFMDGTETLYISHERGRRSGMTRETANQVLSDLMRPRKRS